VGSACSSAKHASSESGPQQGLTTTTIPTTSTPTTPQIVATPKTSALYLSGPINLPKGQSGGLSVIAVGTATNSNDSFIPVIVRNNTSDTVYNVVATGTARRNGALVASGSSQGFSPAQVHPSEWAFGNLSFPLRTSLVTATLDVTATADTRPSSVDQKIDLAIGQAHKSRGELFGDSIDGVLSNQTASTISNPIAVSVACFDGVTVKIVTSGFAFGKDALATNATASFSIMLPRTSCPTYAVGAQGRSS
jgi:hypothetical protein